MSAWRGKYALFQTDGKNWMIHRMDPPLDPAATEMPESVEPMLARTGPLPSDDDEFGYEIKWDGVRVDLLLRPRPRAAAEPQPARLQ